jgi:hypothetical protein
VRVYSRSLSASEITSDMNTPVIGAASTATVYRSAPRRRPPPPSRGSCARRRIHSASMRSTRPGTARRVRRSP